MKSHLISDQTVNLLLIFQSVISLALGFSEGDHSDFLRLNSKNYHRKSPAFSEVSGTNLKPTLREGRSYHRLSTVTESGRSKSTDVPEYEYYYDDYYYYTDELDDKAVSSAAASAKQTQNVPHPTTTIKTSPKNTDSSIVSSTLSKFKLSATKPLTTDYLTTITVDPVHLAHSNMNLTLTQTRTVVSRTRTSVTVSLVPVIAGGSTRTLSLTQTYRVTSTIDALITITVNNDNKQPPEHSISVQELIDGDLDPAEPLQLSASEVQPQRAVPPPNAVVGPVQQMATPSLPNTAASLQHTLGQMALLQLLAPYMNPTLHPAPIVGGVSPMGVGGAKPASGEMQTIVNSSPVLVTTTMTTVRSTPVVVTYQAKPSTDYIRSTVVISTVITSHHLTTTLVPRHHAFNAHLLG